MCLGRDSLIVFHSNVNKFYIEVNRWIHVSPIVCHTLKQANSSLDSGGKWWIHVSSTTIHRSAWTRINTVRISQILCCFSFKYKQSILLDKISHIVKSDHLFDIIVMVINTFTFEDLCIPLLRTYFQIQCTLIHQHLYDHFWNYHTNYKYFGYKNEPKAVAFIMRIYVLKIKTKKLNFMARIFYTNMLSDISNEVLT